MDPTFKVADRSDVDVLLGLRRAFCRHEHLPFDEGAARTALENLLADGSLGKVWLIHLGGAAAGYVVLTFSYSLEFDGRDGDFDHDALDVASEVFAAQVGSRDVDGDVDVEGWAQPRA